MQLARHLVAAPVVGNKDESFNSEQLCDMRSEILGGFNLYLALGSSCCWYCSEIDRYQGTVWAL
jgi:hypothetical protein